MLKKLFIINLLIFSIFGNSQNRSSHDQFSTLVREEIGDMNKDGLEDKVIITMETANITRPLRLQIFFQKRDKTFQLITTSMKILAPQYHKDGKYAGNVLPDVGIENGILNILTERDSNHSEHKFRFQNGNFELIDYFNVIWDGKSTTTETKFDLTSGIYLVQSQELGSDKFTLKEKIKILIKPLPKLQDFVPFENKLY